MKSGVMLELVNENFNFVAAQTLGSLLNNVDFSDVTLVSEDKKQIFAHKAILSSRSQFFKNILALNTQLQPLIYLRVKSSHLQEMMRYIYTGQCEVDQRELDIFLDLAESLEVQGFAADEALKSTKIPEGEVQDLVTPAYFDVEHNHAFKRQNFVEEKENETSTTSEDSKNQNPFSTSAYDEFDINIAKDDLNMGKFSKNLNDKCDIGSKDKEYETADEEKEKVRGSGPFCEQCRITFPSFEFLKKHVSAGHLFCCNSTFSSVKSLNSHKWVHSAERSDPYRHFLEDQEQLSFFTNDSCSSQSQLQAHDKNYFTFR